MKLIWQLLTPSASKLSLSFKINFKRGLIPNWSTFFSYILILSVQSVDLIGLNQEIGGLPV
jgi:hypothetical protein